MNIYEFVLKKLQNGNFFGTPCSMMNIFFHLVGTAITPRPLVIVTTLPFAFLVTLLNISSKAKYIQSENLMSGRTVWIPRISPKTLMSIALLRENAK